MKNVLTHAFLRFFNFHNCYKHYILTFGSRSMNSKYIEIRQNYLLSAPQNKTIVVEEDVGQEDFNLCVRWRVREGGHVVTGVLTVA